MSLIAAFLSLGKQKKPAGKTCWLFLFSQRQKKPAGKTCWLFLRPYF